MLRAVLGFVAVGIAGSIALAAPAAADVSVTPAVAQRGGPAALVFSVPGERPAAHTTKIELLAPEKTPIAEIYPMSVTGWAPLLTSRKLDKPIEVIHGTRTTEVVTKVTWKRVGKAVPKAGEPVLLKVSLGPMPEAEQVAFTIVQTYSDGTVVRWADAPGAAHPAPVVRLLAVEEAGTAETRAAAPATDEPAGGGTPTWLLGAALIVVLAFVGEGLVLYTVDRRATA